MDYYSEIESAFSSMRTLRPLVGVLCVGTGWTMLQLSSPAQAAVFNFINPSPGSTNASIKTFIDSGITLTLKNSNSTGSLNNNTLNTNNPDGLCAWTAVGTTGTGRCGYGTDPSGGVSSFQMSFDTPVYINSFDVSHFNSSGPELASGSIDFSTDNINFTTVPITSTGTKTTLFQALANQTVYVKTSGTFLPANTFNTGLIRISSLQATPVPAPLSVLGLGAAFASRKKLLKLSQALSASRSAAGMGGVTL